MWGGGKMGKRLTFEYVYNYFHEQGCELLEKEYKNSKIKMRYKCECGNISKIIFPNFKSGNRCAKCSIKKRKLSFRYVYNYFKEQECELLEKEYKNCETKMKYKCSCGNISKINFLNFKQGKRCKKCGYEKVSDKTKYSFEYVKKYFKDQGCELLAREYKNSKIKIRYKCSCSYIAKTSFVSFKRGHRCMKCGGREKLTNRGFVERAGKIHNNRYDYSKVDYKRSNIKVIIICRRHGEFLQSPENHLHLTRKIGCPFCRKKNEGEVKIILLRYFKGWEIVPNKKIYDKYKSNKSKRYCDFYLTRKNYSDIIVEYDGEGHFKPIKFGGIKDKNADNRFKRQQMIDRLDKEFCEENNIILHRIKYDEDKKDAIKRLKSDCRLSIV